MCLWFFIENDPPFIENYGPPPYRKLKPLISAYIENSFFGNNRDPCLILTKMCESCEVGADSHSFDVSPLLGLEQAWTPTFNLRLLSVKSLALRDLSA